MIKLDYTHQVQESNHSFSTNSLERENQWNNNSQVPIEPSGQERGMGTPSKVLSKRS